MPIFECRALEKRYGAAMALDHIDLALEPGRIVGLLGPNGSGKSTLIKLAMGLLQPTSGEVLIGGQAPSPQTNAVVSYLPDRITLSPWMKTRQLLDFYGDFFADFDRAAAERMLSQLGLDLNQSVRQMSKGMKEKVQLVLTMSRRAKLYLLDEPIGGVDPATRRWELAAGRIAAGNDLLLKARNELRVDGLIGLKLPGHEVTSCTAVLSD